MDSDPPRDDPPILTARIVAFIEVLLCSGFPTQLALGGTLVWLGYHDRTASGSLAIAYVVGVSLADTVLVIGLIVLFLVVHGERPRDVILGSRPLAKEAVAGVPLIFIALSVALIVIAAVRQFAPWLHDVQQNPFEEMLRTPAGAALFALVVVVAGGVREEVQRAFILHRFDVWLGGPVVGIVVTSIAFGAGHLAQGLDVALAVAPLGALWGIVYLRRRSAVAPIVSHAGFDLLQVVQFLVARHS